MAKPKNKTEKAINLDELTREQLLSFIKENNINLEVTDEMTDEVIREKIASILEAATNAPSEPKERTEQRAKIAEGVFAKNSKQKVLYFTSDMIPFFLESDANRHARSLENTTVVTLNKE